MNWPYAYTPYIWPVLVCAVIAAGAGIYSLHWRSKPGAVPLALTCLFALIWAAGGLLELAAVDRATRIFWYAFQGTWKLATATAEFWFVLELVDPGRWLNRRAVALLSLPVLLILVLTVTNDAHHLIYAGFTADEYPQPVRGIATLAAYGYTFLMAALEIVVLIALAVRSPRHRWPVTLMLLGQLGIRGAVVVEVIGANPVRPLDLMLVSVGVLYVLYALALSRFHLFDLIPMARATGIEQMQTGLVVLNLERRIIDLNPAAEKILDVKARQVRGQSVGVLPCASELQAGLDDLSTTQFQGNAAGSEITLQVGGAARNCALHVSALKDRRGSPLGSMLLFYDITEYKRAQEQIMEQQRALAAAQEREHLGRELHDNLGQVLGYVKMQVHVARDALMKGSRAEADQHLEQLETVVQDAHADVRDYLLGLDPQWPGETGFLSALQRYLCRFSETFHIETELDVSPGMADIALDPTAQLQLLRIIQEALTNTRKHAAAHRVRVTVAGSEGRAGITIEDDGRGFDARLAPAGPEQHYGLGFMRERAAEVGGSVAIDSTPGRGTRVVVEMPIKS